MGVRSFHPRWGWSLPTRGTTPHPQADRSDGPTSPMPTLAGGLDAGTNRPFGLNSQYLRSGPLPPAWAVDKDAVAPSSADPRVGRRLVGMDSILPRRPTRTAGTHVERCLYPRLPSLHQAPCHYLRLVPRRRHTPLQDAARRGPLRHAARSPHGAP